MSRFRSAIGKEVDMAALASKHENVRAAGNMGVNARGDLIDSKNQVIMDNNQRIGSVYNKTIAEKMHSTVVEPTKSDLVPDEPINIPQPAVTEEHDTLSQEEMELLHDDEVAEEDDFSLDDIVKVVNQKP
jgi:hypothetical protein